MTGSAPFTVQFKDLSDGTVASWEWDFGDGTTSDAETPSHRYTIVGTYTVQLSVSGPGGSDTSVMADLITVLPGRAATLEVVPPGATLAVLESAQFEAILRDGFGNVVPDTPGWTVIAEGGSIDPSGIFAAGTVAGSFADTVMASLLTDTGDLIAAAATVNVVSGPVFKVIVQPSKTNLDIGGTQSFEVEVLDKFGNQISDSLVSWKSTTDAGTVDRDGKFTAGIRTGAFSAGIQVVAVKDSTRASATADVSIKPDPLASIDVSPSFAVVEKGASQSFEAVGFDQYRNEVIDLAYSWEATGGDITQEGIFTAGEESGSFEVNVTASFEGNTASETAVVPIPPLWLPLDDMLVARAGHIATLLSDGTVLIAGGNPREAELYDPATRTFSEIGDTICDHGESAKATLLYDGKVLITGGASEARCAEVYNPETRAFARVGDLDADHWEHTATLLRNGKVLIAGGLARVGDFSVTSAAAEIYDPATETFGSTGSLKLDRREHTATLLPSGDLLITGGFRNIASGNSGPSACLRTPELYNAATGTFRQITTMNLTTCHTQATLLDNGHVLITSSDGSAEIFDPETRVSRATEAMTTNREQYSTVLLSNGDTLTAGGYTPVMSPSTKQPVFSEIIKWDFTQSDWGWRADNHIENMSIGFEGLEFDIIGFDPWLTSPKLGLPEGEDIKVTVRMKSDANPLGEIFLRPKVGFDSVVRFSVNADGGWHEYELVIPSRGSGSTLRLDPAHGDGALGHVTIAWISLESSIPSIQLPLNPAYQTVAFWDFTRWTQGWRGGDHIANVFSTPAGLEFDVIGFDPGIDGPPLELPGGRSLKVTIRMKSDANNVGELFHNPEGGQRSVASFAVNPDGEWHEYELIIPPQKVGPGAAALDRTFRLDPASGTPGHVVIAWISLESLVPAARPSAHAAAETYDSAAGTFASIDRMHEARYKHAAVLLSNGQVLVTGGAVPTGIPMTSPAGKSIGERFEDEQLSTVELWIPSNRP